MCIRQAVDADIPGMQRVRASARENTLPDYSVLTPRIYSEHINSLGRGWVCERNARIVGFAVANLCESSVWALFVDPEWERRGIGRALLDTLLAWLRAEGAQSVTLSTEPGTRAASFYEAAGWAFLQFDTHGDALYEKTLTPG